MQGSIKNKFNYVLSYCSEGSTLTLKEIDSDVESRTQEKIRISKIINKLQPRYRRKRAVSENVLKENQKSKDVRRKPSLRKRSKLIKTKDSNDENNENIDKVCKLLLTFL